MSYIYHRHSSGQSARGIGNTKSPGTRLSDTSQSFEDKLNALKYFLYGKGIPYVVLKATTSELIGPKKKHLNYLVNMTHEPNVSIPNMVKHLMLRARCPEWSVSFKAIIAIHHLMTYGNERFIQNLASSTVNNRLFDRLCTYTDRTTSLGYNMSIFVRRYARYITNKIQTYRTQVIDFCRVSQFQPKHNSGKLEVKQQDPYYYYAINSTTTTTTTTTTTPKENDSSFYVCQEDYEDSCATGNNPALRLKKMPAEQLLKLIPNIQSQFDSLLAFNATPDDLFNGVINSAFNMLFRDFLKLYIAYQVAIIRLLELYFATTILKRAREMLELYKKFLVRMFDVREYLTVVDSIGLDKSEMPHLSRTPGLPLKMLEKHIETLSKKYYANNSVSALATPGATRVTELPRIEYGTLGRPRRRSMRTPSLTSLGHRQTSIDLLTPVAALNYKRRQEDEIKRLDKMLNMTSEHSGILESSKQTATMTTKLNICGPHKRKRNCDYGMATSEAILREEDQDGGEPAAPTVHRYEDLVDSLLEATVASTNQVEQQSDKAASKQQNASSPFDWFSLEQNLSSKQTTDCNDNFNSAAQTVDLMSTFDSGVANESGNQRDSLLLND